jgi:hypothetical protein
MLFEIRILTAKFGSTEKLDRSLVPEDRARLDRLHVRFATCLDDLPPQFQPQCLTVGTASELSHKGFVAGVSNLQVTYHCLRMQILEQLEEVGYFNPIEDHGEMLLLRKTEIAHDLVCYIQEAPLWSLQVNGEPCVSGNGASPR